MYSGTVLLVTASICLMIGFLAGFFECKIQQRVADHEEAVRLAVKNTIHESTET